MPTQPPPADRSIQRTEALIDLAADLGRRSANVETGRRRTALITLRTLAAFARHAIRFSARRACPRWPLTNATTAIRSTSCSKRRRARFRSTWTCCYARSPTATMTSSTPAGRATLASGRPPGDRRHRTGGAPRPGRADGDAHLLPEIADHPADSLRSAGRDRL